MTTTTSIAGSSVPDRLSRLWRGICSPAVIRGAAPVLITVFVLWHTGGPSTIGFWFTAVTGYAMLVFLSVCFGVGLIAVLPLLPVLWLLVKIVPRWAEQIGYVLSVAAMLTPPRSSSC